VSTCEKLAACRFINDKLFAMPRTSELLKQSYCLSDKESCARYRLASAGFPIPPSLFPHDAEHVPILINKGRQVI